MSDKEWDDLYFELQSLEKKYGQSLENSPTKKMQDKILEIASYKLYKQMSVEEVESAIEQITVTNKLSQAVLNENVTSFLLAGESNLTNGLQIPFHIFLIFNIFKDRGLKKSNYMPNITNIFLYLLDEAGLGTRPYF